MPRRPEQQQLKPLASFLRARPLQPQPAPDGRPQVAGPVWHLLRAPPAFPALSINCLIRRGAFADVLGGMGVAGVALLRDDRGIAGSVLCRPGTCLCQGSRVRHWGWSCVVVWALLPSPRDSEVAPDCTLVVSWASLDESPPQFGSHQLPNSPSSCSKDHGRSQLSVENLGISCCLLLCDPGIGAGHARLSSVVKVS